MGEGYYFTGSLGRESGGEGGERGCGVGAERGTQTAGALLPYRFPVVDS
jgi:hypothetical protein